MEVLAPLPAAAMDVNFDSSCSTPYISAPSSPKLFGEMYFSAPTSPTRSSALYRNISFVQRRRSSCDGSQFFLVEPESAETLRKCTGDDQVDFAFDFSGHLDVNAISSTAEELFDGGILRPYVPSQLNSSASSPTSKTKMNSSLSEDKERGRERVSVSSSSSSKPKHRATRSHSPLRLSEYVFEQEQEEHIDIVEANSLSKLSSFSFFTKWRLKDLLFRSASEGRAANKDPLKNCRNRVLCKKVEEHLKNSSFRSTGSGSSSGSSHGGGSKRRAPVSPHEMIYKSNRAVHDELKRKTYLPYRKGLLGCVGFNPTVEGITKGLNSIRGG